MRQSTSSARPPAQYIVAPGTQFRLISNEYDKNTYAQCNYASYRTLVRCREIRSKEALAKNGGRCEEHVELSKILEENHKKEVQRVHAENDSKMQRRRFDPWIASNDYISDDDDFLQSVSSLPVEMPDVMNDNPLDEHPLRHAGFFTDKDLVKIKMDLVQKDIDSLVEFKQLLTNQAQKDYEAMKTDETEGPMDMPQKRAHNASAKYSRADYLTLTTVDPVYKQCCVGPKMDDALVVAHVVQGMLDKIDNFAPIPVDKQCEKPTLHFSKFCIDHITLDPRQKLFKMCSSCGLTAIGGLDPSCNFHIKSTHRRKGGATKSFPESRAINATVMCRCHRCIPTDGTTNTDSPGKCEIITSDDDEDTKLANLSRIETMVSPMQQFGPSPTKTAPPVPPPQSRRYQGTPAQVLRPPQMGSTGTSTFSTKTAAQRVVANMREFPPGSAQQIARQRFDAEQQALRLAEEEAKTMTCARIRPVDPSQFGSGKKKQQQPQKQVTPPGPSTPYHFTQQKKIMPSIISPTMPSTSSPFKPEGLPFSGWRNTPATPRSMHQQHQMPTTRLPVHQQNQPKTIPLERVQEPKNAEELLPLCPTLCPVLEPARRGVPYYKNASAYRRTEFPVRVGPHPLLPPPITRPVPPHRAIAAGLNPADAVNPSTPRPSFRVPPPQMMQPQYAHYSARPANNPPSMHYRNRTPGVGPQRLSGGGLTGVSPSKITKSYTVVGSGSRTPSSTSSSPSTRQTVPSRFTNSALDTARTDARFANMNVKTFLSMGNKDFTTMTQEEIDLLAASSQDPPQKRKGPHVMPHVPPVIMSPTTSAQTEQLAAARPPVPPETPLIPIEVAPQAYVAPVAPAAPIVPEASIEPTPTQTPTARTAKKRKVEETIDPVTVPTSSDSAPAGEPASKKAPVRRGSTEKDKPERQSRAKTPKTPAKRSTPPPSESSGGRTPRAAAIAANQAIVHHKPASSSSTASSSVPSSQDDGSAAKVENPLDLLAELSEAAAAEEQQKLETPTKGNKRIPKKASPKDTAATPSTPSTSSSTTS